MIIAQLATLPDRYRMLLQVINSLLPQVDELRISLNNYKEIPKFLTHPKIKAKIFDNTTGDAAKFYDIENIDGYFFSCDDDLRYPPNYISEGIAKIEQYNRKAVISVHGRNMPNRPINSYYKDRFEVYHCLRTVDFDTRVIIGGTGVMGFHTSTLNVKYADFKEANMADIFIGGLAKRQMVPIIVMAHKFDWIKALDPNEEHETIYQMHHNDDSLQTQVYNEMFYNNTIR